MAEIKAGTRLRSAVCATEVMVVAAPAGGATLTCGGAEMLPISAPPASGSQPAADAAGGTQLGKRYVNAAGDLEVLCTKPGAGSLGANGAALAIKEAKPLPSSD